MQPRKLLFLLLVGVASSACMLQSSPVQQAKQRATESAAALPTHTYAVRPRTPAPRPVEASLPEPTPVTDPALWLDPAVPPGLKGSLQFDRPTKLALAPEDANLHLGVSSGGAASAEWVYALAVPFASTLEGVTRAELRRVWRNGAEGAPLEKPLMVTESTRKALESVLGPASPNGVQVIGEDDLLERAWQERPSWALIPFEELDPRWKVLRVDGVSPVDRSFNIERYPLVVHFGVTEKARPATVILPQTNRDPQKLTVVIVTGVTALVRSTGARMEAEGMTYPGRDISAWLRDADITHISNEVSFEPRCPPANPNQTSLMFCSRPEYLELLEYSGADVIELSGNHLVDWRRDSLSYTLDLLKERNLLYYAAGENLEEARRPLLLEHNGNKIAFIGCNPAGPETVWATDTLVGAASCDYEWMKAEIARLREEGYLPIATLQYYENYSMTPSPFEVRDFLPLAEAGAVIVSGSQAHHPKGMTFVGSSLVHFGLGNLYFDQMRMPDGTTPPVFNEADLPIAGTRLEFIDRHVFYDGRYISTELLTAVLEDYARPRPMTGEERAVFLRDIFTASGW